MATRRNFDDPGAHDDRDDGGPKRLRYPCKANQCPMVGAVDELCGYHYRENGSDWGRITQVLKNWECVTEAILTSRRVVTDPVLCVDVKGQDAALRDAWARMLPSVLGSGWKPRVEPRKGENIGDWGRRLEVFMGARIKSDLMNMEVDETRSTPVVEEMRKGLRIKPLGKDEWQ